MRNCLVFFFFNCCHTGLFLGVSRRESQRAWIFWWHPPPLHFTWQTIATFETSLPGTAEDWSWGRCCVSGITLLWDKPALFKIPLHLEFGSPLAEEPQQGKSYSPCNFCRTRLLQFLPTGDRVDTTVERSLEIGKSGNLEIWKFLHSDLVLLKERTR